MSHPALHHNKTIPSWFPRTLTPLPHLLVGYQACQAPGPCVRSLPTHPSHLNVLFAHCAMPPPSPSPLPYFPPLQPSLLMHASSPCAFANHTCHSIVSTPTKPRPSPKSGRDSDFVRPISGPLPAPPHRIRCTILARSPGSRHFTTASSSTQ